MKSIGKVFDDAATKHCDEDGCYVGTCPVNCMASLLNKHMTAKDYWMIFGDYMVIKRLSK
jgi:hypothetical protein